MTLFFAPAELKASVGQRVQVETYISSWGKGQQLEVDAWESSREDDSRL